MSAGYDGEHIASTDKQVMLPPKRTRAESETGDYEPHLDEWTGAAETPKKRKESSDTDLPKNSGKLTAMVRLNCGTGDEAARVSVTIAKNGLDTRFEVTQEGLES